MQALLSEKFSSFSEVIELLRQHKSLARILIEKEIKEPYAGQIFGWFWSIGHPLFLLTLYTVVFSFVFNARIGGTRELPLDYTVYILSGLVPWMTFQQAMTRASLAVSSNASIVRSMIFPLEILPIKTTIAALIVFAVGTAFIALYTLVSVGKLYWIYLMLPVVLTAQILAMAGLSFALAAVATFVKDVKDFVQLFTLACMYIMPIIYLPTWVPRVFIPLIYANPFSYMIWCYQDIFYFGRFEHPLAWVIFLTLSPLLFVFGHRLFRKMKPYFGSVL